MTPATGAKQARVTQKYPGLVYPEEAQTSPQFNPDNYPLWTEPKDWKTPATGIYAFTPKEFQLLIKRANPLNAIRTKQIWIDELRSRMNRGHWSLMDTIEFDWNGVLINGHHRGNAGAGSNAVILVQVSYGHSPENFHKYDDNFKRENATVIGLHLQLDGKAAKKDAAVISSALTWVTRYWDEEDQSLEARTAIYKEDRLNQSKKHPEMEALLANIRNIAKANKVTAKQMPAPESILLALYTLGSDVSQSKTREFIRSVIVGTNLASDDPAYVYREFLRGPVSAGAGKGKFRVYTSFKVKKGLIALRYHLDGVKITRLRDRDGVPRLSEEHEAIFESYLEDQAEQKAASEAAAAAAALAASAPVKPSNRIVVIPPKR